MSFSQTTTSLKQRATAALKQDPKKATILAVLIVLMAGLWARLAFSGGSAARSASAMPLAPIMPPLAPVTDNKPRSVGSSQRLREWLDQPLPQVTGRNIFELNLDYFPIESGHKVADSRTPDDPTFWDQLAKSNDIRADQQHKRENLIQNLRQQAAQLQLTSTVTGPRPKAMINGTMVGEGEIVAQFRVLKIEARSVVVEREGIKLDIPMK